MDFSSGLGLSFGTNDEETNISDGESPDNNEQNQPMQDDGESSEDPTSFQSQVNDPDATPRPSSANQFTSHNPTSFGSPFQSINQPHHQAQPSAPFHLSGNDTGFQDQMNANFESQPNAFHQQVAKSYPNNLKKGIPQTLQFGGDPQFNGHGHPQSGFQSMLNQPRSDNQNAFGNSGMQSQQFMHNNAQNHMSAQAMQQSNFNNQMTGNPPANNFQGLSDPRILQHDYNPHIPRMNDSFQSHLGSSMNTQFQPMSTMAQSMNRNQLGNHSYGSSFATQANMNQMQSGQALRPNNPFQPSNSMQDTQMMNNTTLLRPGSSNPSYAFAHQQPVHPRVALKMREFGLNPDNPAEVETFMDRLKLLRMKKAQETQLKGQAESAGPSRASSSSTVTHHPMDRNEAMNQGMGQGRAWSNRFGQGHTSNPYQSQGNATSGPSMNNQTSQLAFPPVPPHLVLGSNNNPNQPVFGQHPQDYSQLNMNAPIQPYPTPYVPLGSAQIISAGNNVTNQQLRQQLQPPPLQHNSGVQSQQSQPQFDPTIHLHPHHPMANHLHPLQQNQGSQFNHFGQPQQFHHHGLPPEYNPSHGHHSNNFADNGVEPAEPIEEYEDDEQQEEVSEPEEEQQQAEEEQEQEGEVDSDGFSIHSDEISSPPPNIYPIPRPPGIPPSPTPRFPSNEVNPNNAPNRPPPVIGSGNRVWSIAPDAFNAQGNIMDWDKARRRKVGNGLDCECRGTFHKDGKGYYMAEDESSIWCNAGEKHDESENEDENEHQNGEDSEEDEELKGVPKWVKQVLTHGPRIDQKEVRREEEAYRKMMAEKVKKMLARKTAKERGEEIPEENDHDHDHDKDSEMLDIDEARSPGENEANQAKPEWKGKGKRKATAIDSVDDTEIESPLKKWKGKGKAADSDEELDEKQLAKKYKDKVQGKGKGKEKGKGKVFELSAEENNVEDLLFGDSAETTRLAEELGLEPHANAEAIDDDDKDKDSIFGGADVTHDFDNIQLESESTIADPELAATGIILPASFPLPPDLANEEEIEEVPRQAPYKSRRNEGPFNIYQSLLLTPEIILELMRHLSPKQLLALYCISRPFNETLSGWMAHSIKTIVKYQAPYSYKIYPFVLYRELSMLDPLGHLNNSGQIRRVPGLKYHQMVLHRVRVVRDILAALARQHHRCPPGTNHSLKKVWFLMDISTTLDRVRLIHNREFFTDQDLYNIQHFIVKLDMRFNDPTDGPGSDMLRKLMLGQRGLTPLSRLLSRTGFTDLYELQAYMVRYTYAPLRPAEDVIEGMFDVPYGEIGRGHLEGWGKGEKHLMRIDELVMREATRRELGFKEHIAMMFLWGYVDPVTGENLEPSEQECYMSDGEGEEMEPEGDPWEGTGMNMARLESLVLGREESDGEEDGGEGDDGGEWEDEEFEGTEMRPQWS
ncbi:hypothetical protein SBOR_10083 [Sclerotinia borealis F-4128]|uniref:F-box domain-containing protein n=1 Tax=Sclerotinia borealis (strain F-4128) TaxID=1432307 RepID=W9C0U1_SCLBF|nr:hypothetical protein SBOR_10083 [Sclerotinia borealis F-4128]